MAVINFNMPLDYRKIVLMADYYDWSYESTFSPSQIWMSDGFNEITGTSTLNDLKETNDGWSGKITSLTFSEGDSVIFEINDIEYEINNNVFDNGYQIGTQTFFGDIAELANLLSGNDVVIGSNWSDRLAGFNGNDLINGNDGNDWLEGWAGIDTLNGGNGNDTHNGGAGKDILDGGSGTDTADYSDKTTAVKVTLNKSTNATVYVNGVAEDTIKNIENITGGSGADQLTGDSLANTLKGNGGNDILKGGDGNDSLIGGAGTDSLEGGNGNDVYRLEEYRGGNDTILDMGGTDTLEWEDFNGNNALNIEQSGSDLLFKTYAIWNNGKFDTWNESPYQTSTLKNFFTDAGFIENFKSVNPTDPSITLTFVKGTSGTDSNNILVGSSTSESMKGNGGLDVIFAGSGNDSIDGGSGDDRLCGGAGKDTLKGDTGKDTFVFFNGDTGNSSTTRDIISDFVRGVDKIDLNAIDAKSGNSSNDSFTFVSSVNTSNANGALWFSKGVLYGSTDTDTASEFQVELTGVTTLTSSDFWL